MGVRDAARLQARTANHYDSHPFEFLTAEDEERSSSGSPSRFAVLSTRSSGLGSALRRSVAAPAVEPSI